jgi:hypothetical protein
MSAGQAQFKAALGVADAAPGEWHPKVAHEDVTVEPADGAVACGANGCTRGEQLLTTRIRAFGKRVLCPIHALDLIEREIGDDQEER